MRRVALGLLFSFVVGGCSTALVPRADVPELVRDAFQSAGLKAEDIAVDPARAGDVWSATATANGADLVLSIDASAGRITRIELDDSRAISRDQLRAIARYASNRAEDSARARRRVVTTVVLLALVTAGLMVARHFRLREERELGQIDEEP